MPPAYLSQEQFLQLQAALLGRTNIRPRSITEDKLAPGAASAAIVRDGSISNVHIGELTVNALTGGTITGETIILAGAGVIESDNFVSGSAGWQIDGAGNAEFNAATIRGTLEAGDIHIPDQVTAGSFHVDTTGRMWLGATTFDAPAPFRVTAGGAVTATDLTITGGSITINGGVFSVDGVGALVASSATITGAITAGPNSSLPATYLDSGTTAANLTISTWIRSSDYSAGSLGWAIDASGTSEFNEVTIRGDLVAGTISIGSAGFNVDSSGNVWQGNYASYLLARRFKVAQSTGYAFAPIWQVTDDTTGAVRGSVGYNEGSSYMYFTADDQHIRMEALTTGKNASVLAHGTIYLTTTVGNAFVTTGGTGYIYLNSGGHIYADPSDNNSFFIRNTTGGKLILRQTTVTSTPSQHIVFQRDTGSETARVGTISGDAVLLTNYPAGSANYFGVYVNQTTGDLRPRGASSEDLGTSTYPWGTMFADLTNSTTNAQTVNRNSTTKRIQYDGSSIRWKSNVRRWDPPGGRTHLEAISEFEPKAYTKTVKVPKKQIMPENKVFDGDPMEMVEESGEMVGLVAEDIEAALGPEAICYDADGEVVGFADHPLMASIVGALGEVKDRLEALEGT